MKKVLLFFLLVVFSFSFAQKFDAQKLDDYFNILENNHKTMGSFAILKEGQIIYKKSIGFADAENNIKADENTQYRVGSISKTFTAVLVMKAVEKNLLKLDDKLNKYFPEIKNSEKITIEELLNHRSGIHNYTEDPKYLTIQTLPISKLEIVKMIANGGSDFEPNAKFGYSNSNYILLALILEKIEKKSYSDLINDQIVKPLGLKFTNVGGKIDSSKNQAFSYFYIDNKYEKSEETNMSIAFGDGNIVSTPLDLLKFILALENGKLVSKESLAKMKNFKDHYGFGLSEVPFYGKMGFGHNGRIDEFRSVLYYFPETKIGFAMISNQPGFENNDISIAALSAANNMKVSIPEFKTFQIKPEDLQKFVGTYSSADFPLKLDFFIKNNSLYSRATGQSEFPLEATSQNTFKFNQAGITLSFDTEKGTMSFSQGGSNYTLNKEK